MNEAVKRVDLKGKTLTVVVATSGYGNNRSRLAKVNDVYCSLEFRVLATYRKISER